MGTQHPIVEGRSPIDEAVLLGYGEIVDLLAEAGAQPAGDDVDRFISACMAGDRAETEALRAADPTLVEEAIARQPNQLALAAEKGSLDAVELLIELGFDLNAGYWRAPLHEAAMRGNLEIIRLLVAHGADPNLRDRGYQATPAGWAEHHGQTAAQKYLAALER
jgi:ankyrin repeat protein